MMSAAWRALAANAGPLIGAPLLIGLVYGAVAFSGFVALTQAGVIPAIETFAQLPPALWAPEIERAMSTPGFSAALLVWTAGVTVVDAFFRGGLTRMRVAAARGEPVRFGDVVSGGSCFASMLGLRLLVNAPALVSAALRLAAAVLAAPALASAARTVGNVGGLAVLAAMPFGLAFADCFVADGRRGPLAAIRASFAAPAADRGGAFGFLFVAGIVAVAGFCCCGFGGLVSVPYATVCVAILYVRVGGAPAPRA
jgi:hypothetical protein